MSKKSKQSSIQEIINSRLYELVQIQDFKTKATRGLTKNSLNIYCPVCGSDNVHEEMKQLRAGDEQANHIYICLSCGHSGKDNFLTHPKDQPKKGKK